ncbi:MAG TPA: hypothetical protein VHC22_12080 [Pirellulales bacterium]|nr:hypothetical protein [Pirellulales bacterium]
MKEDRTQEDPADKRLFEAVLYVLGDMPSPEREAFEQRLRDDQAAREAVAEAVLICQTASEVLSKSARSPVVSTAAGDVPWSPAGTRRAKMWTTFVLAASLLIAVMVGIGRKFAPADGMGGSPNGDGNQLAVAWLNSELANSPDALLDEDVLLAEDAAGVDEAVGEEEEFAPRDVDFAPPDTDSVPESTGVAPESDWLFEAVAAPPAEPTTSGLARPQEG